MANEIIDPSVEDQKAPTEMKTNDALQFVLDKWKTYSPRWDEFKGAMEDAYLGGMGEPQFPGRLAELCLRQFLEDSLTPEQLNPVKEGDTAKEFVFHTDETGGCVRVDLSSGGNYMEVDQICLIDGLPVVWEMKFSRSTQQRAVIRKSTDIRRREKIANMIKARFGTEKFAYILVLNQEAYKPHSPSQREFVENGGVIVPFCVPDQKIQEQAGQMFFDLHIAPRIKRFNQRRIGGARGGKKTK